ncbi:MAG: HAD family hydrolase [Candidatus Hermodarchaeota archaeon]
MRNKEIRGILFDFDFTLADSTQGVVRCVNYALKKIGFDEFTEKEINKTIGLPLEQTFIKLVGEQHIDYIEKFKHFFIKKADEIMANFTLLFNETPKVIEKLYSNGFKLGIVSTKFRYRIESILRREKLLDHFEVIVGGEDVASLKPNPMGLLLAVQKLDLTSSEVIYIGDSIIDAETANKADIAFIAVLSGVTPRIAFNKYQVLVFLNNISELPLLLSIQGEIKI